MRRVLEVNQTAVQRNIPEPITQTLGMPAVPGVGMTGQTRPWLAETRLICMQGFYCGRTEEVKAKIWRLLYSVRPQLLMGVCGAPAGAEMNS